MITKYHARYYADLLTQQAVGDKLNSLSQSLLSASVDINPHQIEAALFAFRSPLQKGVILADEVGLGKTIEAGLIIGQYWAVGKRRILVICPAALRKQWSYELSEKFGIPNEILDAKNYRDLLGRNRKTKLVLICSYQFVGRHSMEIREMGLDLAIVDEAHKLRNVYKKGSATAHAVKDTLEGTKKILLTATPFQNSLMELYGLTSVVDDDIFGDAAAFRANYMHTEDLSDLRERLSIFYKRTLRQDVQEYINYTRRLPLTQEFDASDKEQELYDGLSEFLRRENLYSIPVRQKMLTTMIIRKIMASSTYAIIGTLESVKKRLQKMLDDDKAQQIKLEDLLDGDEGLSEEYFEEPDSDDEKEKKLDRKAVQEEIDQLQHFINLALEVQHDAKAKALLEALENAFAQAVTHGAQRKALIFTESTRTQQYLQQVLEDAGFAGKIVLFNGSNSDKASNAIYDSWCSHNPNKVSGIKAADRRMAIVEHFKNHAEIMIATEAAAEGLNLQFCSLVVIYDLPWNPQRIEQRIGRCHRYGQKSDVVVVNFVNRRNYADQRVYELLNQKFHLFNDVFGASDEILGQTDGVDFEKRIWLIYQECRTEEEIRAAFDQLQKEMQPEIDSRMTDIKRQVLTSFDIDVQERLRLAKNATGAFLNRYEHIFCELTIFVLGADALFDDAQHSFVLKKSIAGCAPHKYDLVSCVQDGEPYRLSHPLAQYVIKTAKEIDLSNDLLIFHPEDQAMKVSIPDSLKSARGYLTMEILDISSFEREQYCLFTAYKADGTHLSQEECERLFLLGGEVRATSQPLSAATVKKLKENSAQHIQSTLAQVDSRNTAYFKEEEERIFRWERDVIDALERELDQIKRQIREAEREVRNSSNLQEKLDATKKLDALEKAKRRMRNELADREDEAADHRREMIEELDKRRIRETNCLPVFTVEWKVEA